MEITKQITLFKQLIERDYMAKLTHNLKKDLKYLELDFNDIAKIDIELAELVLEDPEDSIKAAMLALEKVDIGAEEGELEKIQILIKNLPKDRNLPMNEISTQLGPLYSFEGIVAKPTEIHPKCNRAKFECPACGNIISVLMLDQLWAEPKRCGCGRKGKFHLMNKELTPSQKLDLIECIDELPEIPRKPVRKKVFLSGSLTRTDLNSKLQPGQRIRVNGWLKEEAIWIRGKVRSNEFKTNIIANNITTIEASWEKIKLTPVQIKKIRAMAKKKTLLTEFAQSLAPTFEGYQLVRESLILQHISGKRIFDKNGKLEERETIHVLMTGEPGTGKTYLMGKSMVVSPLYRWSTGKGLTKAGLVACVVKDEYGAYTLEVGPFISADKGLCGIDEIEKMNKEDYGMLNNGMNEEKTVITKANLHQELRCRTSLLATSNPTHKKWVQSQEIYSQLNPIPGDILDRFDCIWAMREDLDSDKIGDRYNSRHLEEAEEKDQMWSNEEMRLYIAYAKRLIPVISRDTIRYFEAEFGKLTGKTKDEDEGGESSSNRLRGKIFRWIYAHAKFRGIGTEDKDNKIKVTRLSVNYAMGLIRHSFELLNMISEKGFTKFDSIDQVPPKKEVNSFYLIKDILKDLKLLHKNKVPQDEIVKAAQKEKEITEEEVIEALEKLSRAGDIFEPTRKEWSMI